MPTPVETHGVTPAAVADYVQDEIELKYEHIHVGYEGCTPAAGASPVDNYATLAPFFAYTSKIPRSIYFDGQMYGCATTIQSTHRDGLLVYGGGAPTGPWSAANYAHSGATPGAFETGGPGGGLVWTGAPGGTLYQCNGNNHVYQGVNFQGLYHETAGGAVLESIDFTDAAATLFLLKGGDSGLGSTPPFRTPGQLAFYDCNFSSASAGFKAAETYSINHADQCAFYNCGVRGVEDGWLLAGQQAIQNTISHPRIALVKRILRMAGGGQQTLIDPWIGAGFGASEMIHYEHCSVNEGNVVVINGQADATGTSTMKFVSQGAIASGSGASDSAFHTGAAVTAASLSLFRATFIGGKIQSGVSGVLFDLKGGAQVTCLNMDGFTQDFVQFEHINSGSWGGSGPQDVRPKLELLGCNFASNTGLTNTPGANSVAGVAGQKGVLIATTCTFSHGALIANVALDQTW